MLPISRDMPISRDILVSPAYSLSLEYLLLAEAPAGSSTSPWNRGTSVRVSQSGFITLYEAQLLHPLGAPPNRGAARGGARIAVLGRERCDAVSHRHPCRSATSARSGSTETPSETVLKNVGDSALWFTDTVVCITRRNTEKRPSGRAKRPCTNIGRRARTSESTLLVDRGSARGAMDREAPERRTVYAWARDTILCLGRKGGLSLISLWRSGCAASVGVSPFHPSREMARR